jgi:muconolactone delta-isomerase
MLIACLTKEEPRNLSAAELARLRAKARTYYVGLVAELKLYAYYERRESHGQILIFDVESFAEMHRLVMLGPLAMYQQTSIYPLMPVQALGSLTSEMSHSSDSN